LRSAENHDESTSFRWLSCPLEVEMLRRAPIVLLFLAWIADPSWAASRLASAGEAPPLPAWIGFCERQPQECMIDTDEPALIQLEGDMLELLLAVNRTVNASLKPITDLEHWGVTDDWNLPTDGMGDCEDYQLLKRRYLAAAGVPRRALRMTVVLDRLGAGHAVLTVRTDRGDFILDNLTDAVLLWSDVAYTFVKRESSERVGWVFVAPAPERMLVASVQP
jgi:predicted transglutaminase-like cysteine proteinase